MKILIVEDEFIIAQRIERLTKEIVGDQLQSLRVENSLTTAMEFLKTNKIDLLFLDLNLNNQNGFEVLNNFLSQSFQTIIISAYDKKAITAFEYGVLDFIPKPFNKRRLEQAFEKLFKSRHLSPVNLKYLIVKNRGKVKTIRLTEIAYFKGAGIYSEIFLNNGQKELHSKSLDKLNLILPIHYERVHKSYIVNINNVKELVIHMGGKYELHLTNNTKIPLGRTKYLYIKRKWFSED